MGSFLSNALEIANEMSPLAAMSGSRKLCQKVLIEQVAKDPSQTVASNLGKEEGEKLSLMQ